MTAEHIEKELKHKASEEKRLVISSFFKIAKGQYGEGDIFIGVTVPENRLIASVYYQVISYVELLKLLTSNIHECRSCALFILILKYEKAQLDEKTIIIDLYLSHTSYINNWDLVDLSASKLVGKYISETGFDTQMLYKLSHSNSLWERRIAIISTHFFIKQGYFEDTLAIARILLFDDHDLIQKAVGWMLREVGKRDKSVLISFLNQYATVMPRTMLRYAIEKFTLDERRAYMKKD